ncbi:hypothetical protein ACIPYQ_40570 [Streptomyces sp. NPDC090045]|uniref:hypothetical protein n=1 Tax=Streptomyces sp. NPDC090045 TaxID=3365927 RepID=UPI0037FA6516
MVVVAGVLEPGVGEEPGEGVVPAGQFLGPLAEGAGGVVGVGEQGLQVEVRGKGDLVVVLLKGVDLGVGEGPHVALAQAHGVLHRLVEVAHQRLPSALVGGKGVDVEGHVRVVHPVP